MLKFCLSSLLIASVVGISACGGNDQTSGADAPVNQTRVVFSPATSELPIPNDLLFSPPSNADDEQLPADGTMYAGSDPSNPVITGIDALDGNSVLSPFDIKIDGSLNTAQTLSAANFIGSGASVSPNPNQNVFLLPLAYPSGDGLSQASIGGASVEVPTLAEAAEYQAAVAAALGSGDTSGLAALAEVKARAEIISLDGGTNNVLRISPLQPLRPKTKYLVVLTDLEAANGRPILASEAYEFIKDPDANLGGSASLEAVRAAIQGWERLAAGYFGFMQAVFDSAGSTATAPSADDIIFSITFTTAGTTDVLQKIASPEVFFEDSITSGLRKDAIVKLVSGVYALDGTTSSSDSADQATASLLNNLLTDTDSPLYNASIAGAINAGADFTTIAADASAAYLMQLAAAEAAVNVANADGITIAQQAVGTISAIAAGASAPVSAIFPIPAPRPTNFYRNDAASDINASLSSPARVIQGEITLPYFMPTPAGDDLSPLRTGEWEPNATISDAIGADLTVPLAGSDDTESVPPALTYRYPFPTKQADVTVPVLVTIPDEGSGVTKPAEGWPVVIFVHGIGTDRSVSLPLANALAASCLAAPGTQCFATVAIDQPLHGIAPAGSLVPGLNSVDDPDVTITPNVGDNSANINTSERHFNATADAAINAIPMDYSTDFGTSGSLFVNLTSFTTARDNLRQMTVDLLNLNASLATMDLDDDGNPDFDTNNVFFVGHSLGAISGLPFVAVNNSEDVQMGAFTSQPFVKAAAALNTGGGVARLLTNSPSFAPSILGGLAAASDSLVQGNSGLESYLNVFQGILDSADVTNFASMLSEDAGTNTGVLLTEVIGDGTDTNPADQTIPNAADDIWGTPPLSTTVSGSGFVIDNFPAPLAGTEPMLAEFDPDLSSAPGDDAERDVIVTRFTDGNHGTPASADEATAFLEIAAQIFTFFNADGNAPSGGIVSNPDIVQ